MSDEVFIIRILFHGKTKCRPFNIFVWQKMGRRGDVNLYIKRELNTRKQPIEILIAVGMVGISIQKLKIVLKTLKTC